jgi:hypothetical protein
MAIAPGQFDRHDRCGTPLSLAAVSLPSHDATAVSTTPRAISPPPSDSTAGSAPASSEPPRPLSAGDDDPVLCDHCGRTAANGISCIGMCVADSGY